MKIFTRKITAMPRRREGPPRRKGPLRCKGPLKRGHAHLSEPEDNEGGLSSPPRRGIARLGEPLYLGRGRLCLGVLVTI